MTTGPSAQRPNDEASGDVAFVPRRVDHPDAVRMLASFYQEQVGRYGFAESVDLDPAAYSEPNGLFIVVYRDGSPVGCGCCRKFGPERDTVEIKKTYLDPSARGQGLGRQLLDTLERAAMTWGARRTILETGIRNEAALGLFVGNGYTPMARYVASRDPAINRAFEKDLRPSRLRPNAETFQQASA